MPDTLGHRELNDACWETQYKGCRVLLTGHTGFKGGWLAHWLHELGAVVTGLALAPGEAQSSLFQLADVSRLLSSRIGDIRDLATVETAFSEARPELVFHLAAQPLVRRSYGDPLETFSSNVMGTAHVLDAARRCPSVRAIVCVTTDKVYESKEWLWGYREIDPLGGKDPYSASKAACEHIASAYATLYAAEGRVKLATARGGNVIGGGDWAPDRIVVDIVRAVAAGQPVVLRNPSAIRPWQHVLELCRGYLMLGSRLMAGEAGAVGAWNFGPGRANEVTVLKLAQGLLKAMGTDAGAIRIEGSGLLEANFLRLDNAKACDQLGWLPHLSLDQTIAWTAEWYRDNSSSPGRASQLVREQISRYRAARPPQVAAG